MFDDFLHQLVSGSLHYNCTVVITNIVVDTVDQDTHLTGYHRTETDVLLISLRGKPIRRSSAVTERQNVNKSLCVDV